MHYTIYNIHYIIYDIHYTIYNIHYIIYDIHYTIYNIQYIIYIIQYTILFPRRYARGTLLDIFLLWLFKEVHHTAEFM